MFDDVYFSALGGLEETRHVFIAGNNLPENWQGRDHFTICETGFGTGLNFLTAWTLFEETAPPEAILDFISFEKFPLKPEEIKNYLSPWTHVFGGRLDRLCSEYPLRAAGFHRVVLSPRVILTLIFDDVNEALPELEADIDCWFLDGFTPSKNPEMWSETLFGHMEKLSTSGASFATFTAAGFVKRGIEQAGFEVEKVKGFAHKRDMLRGVFKGQRQGRTQKFRKISILGGGVAGTACAHVFRQYGLDSILYEKEDSLAQGASGNRIGLYNPRPNALRGAASDFYTSAFSLALRQFSKFDEIDFKPCGALHLITDEAKQKRFSKMIENWCWQDGGLQLLYAQQASDVAGIPLEQEAFFLPQSGYVSPSKLCRAYAGETEVKYGTPGRPGEDDSDVTVLADGIGVKDIFPDFPVYTVRGQVSLCEENETSQGLKTALCYGGYVCPAVDGVHVVGSTFQKWLDHCDLLEEDHQANLDHLTEAVPALAGLQAQDGRAGLRVASKDRFPLIGPAGGGIYVSAAHGSHGLLGSLAGAHLLADMLRGGPFSLPKRTVKALSPERFG